MDKEQVEQLKAEAKELGITFSPNISGEKLQDKIDEYYKAQESSGEEIIAAVVAKEKSEEKKSAVARKPIEVIAKELYDEARKTKVVTIIDNDQRVNNQTTTCSANWSNAFYDMGTQSFPLNTPIEIPIGFINVLKEVKIPHHVKDSKTNLSTTVMRSRYAITEENIDK